MGSASISEQRSYGSFRMVGYNSNVFDMNIMNMFINDYAYLDKVTADDFYDYLPTAGSTLSLGINTTTPPLELISGDNVFSYTNTNLRPFPYATAIADGITYEKLDRLYSLPILFLQIDNQVGFLNYYTETP